VVGVDIDFCSWLGLSKFTGYGERASARNDMGVCSDVKHIQPFFDKRDILILDIYKLNRKLYPTYEQVQFFFAKA
jgi:hypothetical protein